MAKLLIVENDLRICENFNEMFKLYDDFEVDIVTTYSEAEKLLKTQRYEFGVADVEGTNNGEIIALLNKYNVSPIIFTNNIDEEFVESFQSANIVDYCIKSRYQSTNQIVNKLRQLVLNKQTTILIVSNTKIYTRYIKENLVMHNFKVFIAENSVEALSKIELHPELDLIITEYDLPYVNGIELVKKIRQTNSKDELKILTLANEPSSYQTTCFLNEGVNDFLVKEFSREEFYARIYQNVKQL